MILRKPNLTIFIRIDIRNKKRVVSEECISACLISTKRGLMTANDDQVTLNCTGCCRRFLEIWRRKKKLATEKVRAIRYTGCTPHFLEGQSCLYDEIMDLSLFMKKRGYEEVVETDE